MYRILIVDDDPWMLEYLSKCIQWDTLGIDQVYEAESGETAIEKMKKHKIDVVISDVKMGEKDGIQLLKEIRESYPLVKVILLSGIDSARNVREAFHMGAVDFLFKPVDTKALHKLIRTILFNLEKEQGEKIINALLRGENGCVSGLPEWLEKGAGKRLWIINVQNQGCEEKVQKKLDAGEHVITGMVDDDLILIQDCALEKDVLPLKKISEEGVIIGISEEFTEIHNLRRVYEKTKEAMKRRFYDRTQTVFWEVDNKESERIFDIVQSINILSNILHVRKFEEAERLLNEIFKELSIVKPPIATVHMLQVRLMDIFYHMIDKSNQNPEQVFSGEYDLQKHYERLCFEDIDGMKKWVFSCFRQCISCLENESGSSKRKVIQDIEEIITKNLDKEISLEKIAAQLYLNPSYLSRLFKENVGKSYTKYVTEKRIERAKELLREQNYKIYEVGELVGYENTKYFNKIFKELVGVTPKEYRERVRVSDK